MPDIFDTLEAPATRDVFDEADGDVFDQVSTPGKATFNVNPRAAKKQDLQAQLATERLAGNLQQINTDKLSEGQALVQEASRLPSTILNQPGRAANLLLRAQGRPESPDTFQPNKPIVTLPNSLKPYEADESVSAGLGRLAGNLVEGLTTPEMVVAGPAAAESAAVRALFGMQIAGQLPEQAAQAGTVLGDINSTPAQKVVAVGEPLANAAFAGLLAKSHGVKGDVFDEAVGGTGVAPVDARVSRESSEAARATRAATPGTGVPPETTVPESPDTIAAQMGLFREGKKPAVLITRGVEMPELQPGEAVTVAGPGAFIHRPGELSADAVRQAVSEDKVGDLLGYGIERKPAPGTEAGAIVVRDGEGKEIQSVVTDAANAPNVARAAEQVKPVGGTVTLEDPAKVIEERVQAKQAAADAPPEESRPAETIAPAGTSAAETGNGAGRTGAVVGEETLSPQTVNWEAKPEKFQIVSKNIRTANGSRYYDVLFKGDWYQVRLADHLNTTEQADILKQKSLETSSMAARLKPETGMDHPHWLNVELRKPVKSEAEARKVILQVLREQGEMPREASGSEVYGTSESRSLKDEFFAAEEARHLEAARRNDAERLGIPYEQHVEQLRAAEEYAKSPEAKLERLKEALSRSERALKLGVQSVKQGDHVNVLEHKPLSTELQWERARERVQMLQQQIAELEAARESGTSRETSRQDDSLKSADQSSIQPIGQRGKAVVGTESQTTASAGTESSVSEPVKPSLDDKLKALAARLSDPRQVGGTPFGVERVIAYGAVQIARGALRAGRTIGQAIQDAVNWIRAHHPTAKFDEPVFRAKLNESLKGSPLEQLTAAAALTDNPTAPLHTRIRLLQKLGDSFVDKKDAVGRGLVNMRATGLALYHSLVRLPPATPYLKSTGRWSAAVQEAQHQARLFVEQINRTVKDPLRREAMTNWIQADGDLALLRSRAAASDGRIKRGYEMALSLTPEEQGLARRIGEYFDERLAEGMRAGILTHGLDNYITQIWKRENEVTRALRASLDSSRLPVNFQFARKRIFDSYFEGEQKGFAPANKDVGALIAAHSVAFDQSLAARAYVKSLTKGKALDGRPLAVTQGSGELLEAGDAHASDALLIQARTKPEVKVTKDGETTQEPTTDYRILDHPALRGWRWVGETAKGTPVMLKGDLLVHPEVYQHLKNNLSTSALRRQPIVAGLLKLQSAMKQTSFSLSPFHQVQEGVHALGHKVNPLQTLTVDFKDAAQRELINAGLQVAAYDSHAAFDSGYRGGGPIIGRVPGLGEMQAAYTNWLFHEHIPRLKMTMAVNAMERNVARFAKDLASGKVTRDDVAQLTARQANAAFGEQNYRMLGRNPTLQDTLRLFLVAPDFLEARLRFTGQAAQGLVNKSGREQLMALGLIAATSYISARVLNQILDNDPHWDKPFSVVSGKRVYSLRSVPADIEEAITDIHRFSSNRLSPLLGKGLIEYFTGRDYRGVKVDSSRQLQDLLGNAVPMSLRTKPGDKLWEQAVSAAGLRNKPFTATQQIRALADDFNSTQRIARGDERPAVEVIGDSVYAPLRRALDADDMDASRAEWNKLIKSKQAVAAQRAMAEATFAPFTGSKAREMQFLHTLTGDQRKVYDEARREHAARFEKFQRVVSGR